MVQFILQSYFSGILILPFDILTTHQFEITPFRQTIARPHIYFSDGIEVFAVSKLSISVHAKSCRALLPLSGP